MSRSIKDKPYHVLSAQAAKSRNQSHHDHARIGTTRIVERKKRNPDGYIIMETVETISILTPYEYSTQNGVDAFNAVYGLPKGINPSTHTLNLWVQPVGDSEEIDALVATRERQFGNRYQYSDIRFNDTLVFVRETVTRPAVERVEVPFYAVDECSIDVEPSPENRWGRDLPCTYSPDVYRSGNTSSYDRYRKHREARRNRHVAKAGSRAVVRELNHEGWDDTDAYIVDSVLRKRWDWD